MWWLFSRKLQVTITAERYANHWRPLRFGSLERPVFGTLAIHLAFLPQGVFYELFHFQRTQEPIVVGVKHVKPQYSRQCSLACCNALKTYHQVSQNLCEFSCHPSCCSQFAIILPSSSFMWLHVACMLSQVPNTKRIFSSSEDISWQHKAKAVVTGCGIGRMERITPDCAKAQKASML